MNEDKLKTDRRIKNVQLLYFRAVVKIFFGQS